MNCAILLSGGAGVRMGAGLPKQYLSLCSKPVITYSLCTLNSQPEVDLIVIVADEEWRELLSRWMEEDKIAKFLTFADPGQTRQFSILSSLKTLRECSVTIGSIIIHDAARPFVSSELISRCMNALCRHDGVMPVLQAKDTYYLTDTNGKVVQLLNRSALVAGQAPEVFDYEKYYEAITELSTDELLKVSGSTEIAILAGLDVVTVPGDERNIKITTPNDLLLAEKLLEEDKRNG